MKLYMLAALGGVFLFARATTNYTPMATALSYS